MKLLSIGKWIWKAVLIVGALAGFVVLAGIPAYRFIRSKMGR